MSTADALPKLQQLVQDILQRDDSTQILGTAGLTVVFLVWAYYRFIATPDLSFIPRAGKAPGPLGFGINDVKRDFAKNGTKIIKRRLPKGKVSTAIRPNKRNWLTLYLQNKNGMFLVQTLNVERVVLSPKYIEEINSKVPDGTLDMVEGLREVRLTEAFSGFITDNIEATS